MLRNSWNLDEICLWLDYACVDQDSPELKAAGIKSLLSYAAACELLLVPVSETPVFPVAHMVPDRYGERAWTRLEAFTFYVISMLRGKALPQLYTCSEDGKVERLDYDLLPDAMPASGTLTHSSDLPYIRSHQITLLESLQRRALIEAQKALDNNHNLDATRAASLESSSRRRSFRESQSQQPTCVGPALIALAALGNFKGVQELLSLNVYVDTSDNRGYTALISASRYDHADIVKMLLEANACVECENSFGWTPLVMCARKGNVHLAKLLLEAAADPSHGCKGKMPLQIAQSKGHGEVAALLVEYGTIGWARTSHCRTEEKTVFKEGDRVKVKKDSRIKDKFATVLDPQWYGLVKLQLEEPDPTGRIKTVMPAELELVFSAKKRHSDNNERQVSSSTSSYQSSQQHTEMAGRAIAEGPHEAAQNEQPNRGSEQIVHWGSVLSLAEKQLSQQGSPREAQERLQEALGGLEPPPLITQEAATTRSGCRPKRGFLSKPMSFKRLRWVMGRH